MKKLLLYIVKFINNFTNEKLTPEQEAESIVKFLLWKSSAQHTMDVNEAMQRILKTKFLHIREDYLKVVSKIDEAYPEPEKIIYHLNEKQKP